MSALLDPTTALLANSPFNAAGFEAAMLLTASPFHRSRWRIAWLLPIVFLCAWLESAFHPPPERYRRIAADCAGWIAIALTITAVRRRLQGNAPQSRSGLTLEGHQDDSLSASLLAFLEAGENGD